MPASLNYFKDWHRRHEDDLDPIEVEAIYRRRGDKRSLAQKDRDKILYSPFLRRLGGVSQVVPSGKQQRIHNRLTHSLEVSQLARRIASREEKTKIGRALQVDLDVAEAAGLAHDLGHPPFGHVGEKALDHLLTHYKHPELDGKEEDYGGFEGNAQTLRILGVLSASSVSGKTLPGMKLTRATYASVIKYPWERSSNPDVHKFGVYCQKADSELHQWIVNNADFLVRPPECEIMDYADDVVYAVIDVCDFVRNGNFDLRKHSDVGFFKDFVEEAIVTPHSPFTRADEERIGWKSLTKTIESMFAIAPTGDINTSRADTELEQWKGFMMDQLTLPVSSSQMPFALREYGDLEDYHGHKVFRCHKVHSRASTQLKILKALTWVHVINKSFDLAVMQRQADTILRKLVWYFDAGIDEYIKKRNRKLSSMLAPYLFLIDKLEEVEADSRRYEQVRVAADITASLTDSEAIRLYKKLMLSSYLEKSY